MLITEQGIDDYISGMVQITVWIQEFPERNKQCNDNDEAEECVLRGEQFQFGLNAAMSHTHPG